MRPGRAPYDAAAADAVHSLSDTISSYLQWGKDKVSTVQDTTTKSTKVRPVTTQYEIGSSYTHGACIFIACLFLGYVPDYDLQDVKIVQHR